jgi:hypothetical protein
LYFPTWIQQGGERRPYLLGKFFSAIARQFAQWNQVRAAAPKTKTAWQSNASVNAIRAGTKNKIGARQLRNENWNAPLPEDPDILPSGPPSEGNAAWYHSAVGGRQG